MEVTYTSHAKFKFESLKKYGFVLTQQDVEKAVKNPDREEVGPFIVHFDKKGLPILFEILDASEFLSQTTKITMKAREGEKVELTA
ncbi:MAG: hypothetical protein QMD21_06740 [Candidatus Thermoplasmatota archaeon]|nr:hypothetical protein [Candidatus Thermoplasmatota archaeon]